MFWLHSRSTLCRRFIPGEKMPLFRQNPGVAVAPALFSGLILLLTGCGGQSAPPTPTGNGDLTDPRATASDAAPARLGGGLVITAQGPEPYWTAEIGPEWMVFSRPGLPEIEGLLDQPIPDPQSWPDGRLARTAGALSLTLENKACADAAGFGEPLQVAVAFEGVDYRGCGRIAAAETAGEPDAPFTGAWVAEIPSIIPTIDACLALSPEKAAALVAVIALDEGGVLLRFDGQGARFDCAPGADGALTLAPVSPQDGALFGEGAARFWRGTAAPAADACSSAEPILAADGETLGTLLRPTC